MAEVEEHNDPNAQPAKKPVEVPDILMHLVGHMDDNPANHDNDDPAPDEDYIISGNALVKALSVCLGNKGQDIRQPSRDLMRMDEDKKAVPSITRSNDTKMKAMSMNMLDSARRIRSRLQPALQRECARGDEMSLSEFASKSIRQYLIQIEKLQFLDATLKRIVEQFEDEYPECRQQTPTEAQVGKLQPGEEGGSSLSRQTSRVPADDDDENADDEDISFTKSVSRRGSNISLASRNLAIEEGRVHRAGTQVKREVYGHLGKRPDELNEDEVDDLEEKREKFESLSGEELKARLDDCESNDKAELVERLLKKTHKQRQQDLAATVR